MNTKEIDTISYITDSKLPDADYVINPYVGCPHKCIYCYAEFMKRFTNHTEDWGEFIDIKICKKPMNFSRISPNETILIGSVTDAYNPFEKKYEITRKILSELVSCKSKIEILTKSDLVLRDIDIIKQIRNIKVGISLNTLDDSFRKQTEPRAASIERRIDALRQFKEAGIATYLFMSPIFPVISDYKAIIEKSNGYFDYVCFENLNLRGAYLPRVLNFIQINYPDISPLYNKIYKDKDISYWEALKKEISEYCESNKVDYRMYFYHDLIKKQKNVKKNIINK